MQLQRTPGRHIWPGLPRGWRRRPEGTDMETKGDLSDQTTACWLPAKCGEGPGTWLLLLFGPHQPLRMTPHREGDGFYFSVYSLWLASVYGADDIMMHLGYPNGSTQYTQLPPLKMMSYFDMCMPMLH